MKKKVKYKWKRNALGGTNGDKVGKEIIKIMKANEGVVLPETLVKSARPISSSIHNCFEWDNTVAAEKYRVEQARYMLRQVVVITEDEEPIEVRAFVNIASADDNEGYYTTIQKVVETPELYMNYEQQIYRELLAIKNKARNLKRFKAVWQALDKIKIV